MCRRWGVSVVLALAVAALVVPAGAAGQAPAPKPDDPCDAAPGLVSKVGCQTGNAVAGAADKIDGATRAAGAVAKDVAEKGAVGAAASAAGDQVMAGVTAWVAARRAGSSGRSATPSTRARRPRSTRAGFAPTTDRWRSSRPCSPSR